ncbi:MAG: hypothetical protein ACRC5Q_02475, partial [Culicoidibacterales bacterium]
MMIIQQAVLHIFDFETQMHVFSQHPLNVSNEDVLEFVSKQIASIHTDLQHQVARIGLASILMQSVATYRTERNFMQFSQVIATELS